MEQNFQKKGLLISPNTTNWWWKSHAMTPTPLKLENDIYRIYFSGRDELNRSQIGWAEIKIISDKLTIISLSQEPVLTNGRLGTFDDNGVTPSCLIKIDKKVFLYYIGWNPGSTTRMNIFGGLAISYDFGLNFKRYSHAPIIERNKINPFINTSPFVIKVSEELYYMYYVAGTEWINKDLPKYNIQLATSKNGADWKRTGHVCIDYKNQNEVALARPFVIEKKGLFEMWFCSKSIDTEYKIEYASSNDGLNWQRKDNIFFNFHENNTCKWDEVMQAYPCILRNNEFEFMLYNGNNYGYEGFGYAVRKLTQ